MPEHRQLLHIPAQGGHYIDGVFEWPSAPVGTVVFAHGSGSGRHSPRNNFVASQLRLAGSATLLIDLLTPEEDLDYQRRFDIELLSARLADAVGYLALLPIAAALPVGLFGASTGAAAALRLAARRPEKIGAVVSRGGRPDLACAADLARVRAPTLLIVGGWDEPVIELNRDALRQLGCVKDLVVVPGATHLFEEPGTLEQVASLASAWFVHHLQPVGN